MGKKGKARRKQEKASRKRAVKSANRTKYAELKRLGQNTKSKRSKLNNKKEKKKKWVGHSPKKCGNIGCKKCDPCNLHK